MGNTASHGSGAQSPAAGQAPLADQGSSTPAAASAAPVPTASGSRTPVPGGGHPSGPVAFHSGLTPPAQPPSPAPPPTPPLLPFGGHLSAQNPHALSHPQAHDYSKHIVTSLILEGRLAPFYRGLEDWEEGFTEADIERILMDVREKDYEDGVGNSVSEGMKLEREGEGGGKGSMAKRIGIHRDRGRDDRMQLEKEDSLQRERKAYVGATECPICFLNYPPNINTSRCCQQPLCTECFVQIKRSEATITHLESESACCPYCMETDFGVIYERPPDPLASMGSALAVSPDTGTSGFSQAMSLGSEAELSLGPGMAPKIQEKVRRKSVNAKSDEVVTIDRIRPDWEMKLNAVKAAAARKASRRIVMRQVGDRLVPIGYTSARAPPLAETPPTPPTSNNASEGEHGSRRSRRTAASRGVDLEELMIMEAMRLSMVDHEAHQRKIIDENRNKSADDAPAPSGSPSGAEPSRRRGSDAPKASAASKLLSKFGNRSRASSSASKSGTNADRHVSFSPSGGTSRTSLTSASGLNLNSAIEGSATPASPTVPSTAPMVMPSRTAFIQPQAARSPPNSFRPAHAVPIAPVTTLDSASAPYPSSPSGSGAAAGLPRLSLDMPVMTPDATGRAGPGGYSGGSGFAHSNRAPLVRADTDVSEAPTEGATYDELGSDEE